MATYSFLDVHLSITGPGGSFNMGQGAAPDKEGFSITPAEDIDVMTIGADGSPMHSLRANKGGTLSAVYLKTSPINQKLMQMYDLQTSTSTLHGQNTLTMVNTATGDVISMQQGAFKKAPELKYGEEAGTNTWEFNIGRIYRVLGATT